MSTIPKARGNEFLNASKLHTYIRLLAEFVIIFGLEMKDVRISGLG